MDTSPTSPTTWPTTAMSTAWYTYCKMFTAMSGNANESSCRNSGPSEKEIVDAEEAMGHLGGSECENGRRQGLATAAATRCAQRMKKRRGRSHPRRSRFPASRHRRQGVPLGGAPPDADDYVRPCSVRCFIGDHAQSGSPAKYHWFPQRGGCNAGQHTAPAGSRQPRATPTPR